MKKFKVEGLVMINGQKEIKVDEIIWAKNEFIAESRILTMIISEHGLTGYWIDDPKVINLNK